MKKLTVLLVSLFLLFGCSKKEEVKEVEKKPYYGGHTFPTEYLSPSNIQWSKDPLPKDIEFSNELKTWYRGVDQDSVSQWSYVSLLDDKDQQVILQGSGSTGGGLNFLILSKTSSGWKTLADIHGGFIFYSVPNKKHTLVVYNKSGLEYWRTESQFNGQNYTRKSSYEVPIELTRFDGNGSPINFYKYFWFMNGVRVEK